MIKNTIQKQKYLVIAFSAPTMGFLMEKYKREDNLDGRLIPLPKEIDAGCGVAFATQNIDVEYWKEYLNTKKIQYAAMKEIIL